MHALLKKYIIAEAQRVGSQLDWAATLISRVIIKKLTSENRAIKYDVLDKDHNNVIGYLTIDEFFSEPSINDVLMIDIDDERSKNKTELEAQVILNKYNIEQINVQLNLFNTHHLSTSGSYLLEENTIIIRIYFPIIAFKTKQINIQKTLHSFFGELIPDIKRTIRHELQHAHQAYQGSKYKSHFFNKYITYPHNFRAFSANALVQRINDYYMQEIELDSKVVDIMKHAKASKKHVNDIIRELVLKIAKGIIIMLQQREIPEYAVGLMTPQDISKETEEKLSKFLVKFQTELQKRIQKKYPNINYK